MYIVYDIKSPYSVEKSDIYQIKKICVSIDQRSLELSTQLVTLVEILLKYQNIKNA